MGDSDIYSEACRAERVETHCPGVEIEPKALCDVDRNYGKSTCHLSLQEGVFYTLSASRLRLTISKCLPVMGKNKLIGLWM